MGMLDEARDEMDGINQQLQWEEPLIPFELHAGTEEHKARLSHFINTVVKGSPFGKKLLEEAFDAGYSLGIGYLNNAAGFCNEEKKRIMLNASFSNDTLTYILVHEARHAQQDCREDWGSKRGQHDFATEVMLYRAMEADAQTAAVTACHEIKENTGNRGPYLTMYEHSPSIVRAFAAAQGDDKQVTPQMMRAAFNGWYEHTEIVEAYEQDYLSARMNMAVETGDYSKTPYNQSLTSKQIVEAYCTDADGMCYWANDLDVLSDRKKLEISEKTWGDADKFFRSRQEKTGQENDFAYADLKIRYNESSFSESFGLLKQAFSGEYMKNFKRDLNAEVAVQKEGSLFERRRMNHLINEVCKDKNAKKDLETLKSAGYSLVMESLGKSMSVRDDRNKVVVLARRGSDQELQDALKKEARSVGKTFEAIRMKQAGLSR